MDAQVTKMSTRGQVVIPEEVRADLGLEAGAQFVVYGNKEADSILLKRLEFPDPVKAFKEMADWGVKHSERHGLNTSPERIVEAQHKRRR